MADEQEEYKGNYIVTASRDGVVVVDTIITSEKLGAVTRLLNSEMLDVVAIPTDEEIPDRS